MAERTSSFCSWGMYAFTDSLRDAWTALFDTVSPGLARCGKLDNELRFDADDATLRHPDLLIGQTCGYPLVKFYRDSLLPIFVPVFDVEGCEGTLYSSAIIVAANSSYRSLEDCAGKTVAINGPDSNSGMNTLRAAVRPFMHGDSFFSSTLVSGAHIDSLRAVREGRADVAAIDCAMLAFIEKEFPDLVEMVRIVGFTAKTCGLPFVVPVARSELLERNAISALFNDALESLSETHRGALRITEFKPVSPRDYASIASMESNANLAGHSALSI